MLLDENDFKPVRIAGFILIGCAIYGFAFHADSLNESVGTRWFIIITTIWHLATGLGILSRKMWGFYLLKIYLYILILGLPIGTYIAIKSLRYIKEKKIMKFFEGKFIEI